MSNNKVLDFIKIYKWHVLIWAIGLVVLANYVYQKVTSPTVLLNGIYLCADGGEEVASALADDFTVVAGYEDTVYAVVFDTSHSYIPGDESQAENNFEATEAIVSQTEDQALDFVAGPKDSMLDIAYNAIFSELTVLLNAEQLAMVEPYLLYIDNAVMTQIEDAYENDEDTSAIELPDPTKPENMKEPLAVLIDVSSVPEIAEIYGNPDGTIALGCIASAPNEDILLQFIEYLMK